MEPWRRDKTDTKYMKSNTTRLQYDDWLGKFENPKTSDDTFTPPGIFEIIVKYCESKYGISRDNIVRPFYPGGDYQNFEYLENDVVIDNPPFSIMSEIVRFYMDRGIKFFLFGPGLVLNSGAPETCRTQIIISESIEFENGAKIKAAFYTNLENEYIARTSPTLDRMIKVYKGNGSKQKPKYELPANIWTAAKLSTLSSRDVRIGIKDGVGLTALDFQKDCKKSIFGSGLLVADHDVEYDSEEIFKKNERPVMVWSLSEREKAILNDLNNGTSDCSLRAKKRTTG